MRRVTIFAMSLLVLVYACSSPGPQNSFGGPQDERTTALVSLAAGHHKRADIALQEGKRQVAKEEMGFLLSTAQKSGVTTPGGYDVRFDAAGRLARLHLEDEEVPQAEAAALRGLEGAERAPATLFHGHLHQILADVLEKKGDLRGAVEHHGQAIELFKTILETRADPAAGSNNGSTGAP